MRVVILLCLFSCLVLHGHGQWCNIDSLRLGSNSELLDKLDAMLARKELFEICKRTVIDSLTGVINSPELSVEDAYCTNNQLIDEYISYKYDSTLAYMERNMALAQRSGMRDWCDQQAIRAAVALSVGGMYTEAVDMLRQVEPGRLDKSLLSQYYNCMENLYLYRSKYAEGTYFAPIYKRKMGGYVDSLVLISTPGDGDYYALLCRQQRKNGNMREALDYQIKHIERQQFGSHEYARSAAIAASICAMMPGMEQHRERWLILSAMCDLLCAVRENESIRDLAWVLFERGDVERAYRYCLSAMDDADMYDARLRRIEVAKIHPIIEKAYRDMLDASHRKMRTYFIVVCAMLLVLLMLLAVVYRQMSLIRRGRRELTTANEQLRSLNASLLESNHIKEEYIGHYMNLCSSYITKLERYQKMVYNRISTGRLDELKSMSRSTQIIDYEIKEFYEMFDKIFLKIYPRFVESFNGLLREEERITLRGDELLSTEMRIFALIRLGINDSSQIAHFLRYSANTVYTYRTKVKNKAIDRKNFENDIMTIGLY